MDIASHLPPLLRQDAFGERPRPQGEPLSTADHVKDNPAYTVSLSPEALEHMRNHETLIHGSPQEYAGDIKPLEMYAVPDWYTEYGFQAASTLGAPVRDQAPGLSREEKAEYSGRVRGHYETVMDKHGVTDVESHYQKTIVDQVSSDAMRRDMADLVQNDARLMAFMERLGKDIP